MFRRPVIVGRPGTGGASFVFRQKIHFFQLFQHSASRSRVIDQVVKDPVDYVWKKGRKWRVVGRRAVQKEVYCCRLVRRQNCNFRGVLRGNECVNRRRTLCTSPQKSAVECLNGR